MMKSPSTESVMATTDHFWFIPLLTSALLLLSLQACIADSGNAGGDLGLIYDRDFTVVSGSAFQNGDSLEIVLSDEEGEGCQGLGIENSIGNRLVNLTAPETNTGTWSTNQGAQIGVQIRNEGGVYEGRSIQGELTLTDLTLTENGEVSGRVNGTSPQGDALDGTFFVSFCP